MKQALQALKKNEHQPKMMAYHLLYACLEKIEFRMSDELEEVFSQIEQLLDYESCQCENLLCAPTRETVRRRVEKAALVAMSVLKLAPCATGSPHLTVQSVPAFRPTTTTTSSRSLQRSTVGRGAVPGRWRPRVVPVCQCATPEPKPSPTRWRHRPHPSIFLQPFRVCSLVLK